MAPEGIFILSACALAIFFGYAWFMLYKRPKLREGIKDLYIDIGMYQSIIEGSSDSQEKVGVVPHGAADSLRKRLSSIRRWSWLLPQSCATDFDILENCIQEIDSAEATEWVGGLIEG